MESLPPEIVRQIDNLAEPHSMLKQDPPKQLHHYTSNNALLSVVTNRKIWFTHAFFMNDNSEFSHGMNMFRGAIARLSIGERHKSYLKNLFEEQSRNPRAIPYIFSMTERADEYTQWKKYGDDKKGTMLTFNTERFAPLVPGTDAGFELRPVIYDPECQKCIVDSIVKNLCKLTLKLICQYPHFYDALMASISLAFFRSAFLHSICFKSKHWKNESEWRAIILTDGLHSYAKSREKDGILVPYFELGFPHSADLISKLTIGPRSRAKKQSLPLEQIRIQRCLTYSIETSNVEASCGLFRRISYLR